MAESLAGSDSSHDSGGEGRASTQDKQTASKDKECPYCHQRFTSSSLGRHLDQFLNKKKPDGLHNVEEIKKLRSGITRRTARGSKKNGDANHAMTKHDESRAWTQSPKAPSVPASFVVSETPRQPDCLDSKYTSRAGWQVTGVITDPALRSNTLNTTTQASPVSMPNGGTGAGTKRNFATYSADLPTPVISANEHARALELSLREVLDAVNVATRRAAPLPEPFPFDLTAQTFPGLCLKLLPHPQTLFQTSPFSTPETIPLRPPGPEQLQALRIKIKYILDDWKWDALAHAQKNSKNDGLSVGEEAERVTQRANQRIDESLQHLDMAFQYYMSNPPDHQCRIWDLELLRAHKTEQDALKQAKEQIVRITQEAAQLQQQIEYLSKCQWPREMALWPPTRNTFGSDVQRELTEHKRTSTDRHTGPGATDLSAARCVDEERWDFDHLINKWRRHIREDRARRGVSGGTAMLPPGEHIDRTGTPPVGVGVAGLRKSDSAGQNGYYSESRTNSPTTRNGFHSIGVTDKAITFANQDQSSASKTCAATPSTTSNPSASRAQTPFQGANVGIISDHDTIYSRVAQYYRQEAQEKQRENEIVGD